MSPSCETYFGRQAIAHSHLQRRCRGCLQNSSRAASMASSNVVHGHHDSPFGDEVSGKDKRSVASMKGEKISSILVDDDVDCSIDGLRVE